VHCVNENRKKCKRLRWQAASHGCHCFDRAFILVECSVEAVTTMIGCCVSCGFRLCNARNASDCVYMETGLEPITKRASHAPVSETDYPYPTIQFCPAFQRSTRSFLCLPHTRHTVSCVKKCSVLSDRHRSMTANVMDMSLQIHAAVQFITHVFCLRTNVLFHVTRLPDSLLVLICLTQLKGTHKVRSHADDWLRHLANVDESQF